MSQHDAFVAGEEFLGRYNAKKNKGVRRKEGPGNFVSTPTGDLTPSRYLTQHAKKRMAERGVSQRDAIKGTTKSGAVVAPNGAVVTVIPEAWAASDREKKRAEKEASKAERTNVLVPDAIPDGHSREEITLDQSNIMGLVLGTKHCNIKRSIPKQPGPTARYHVTGNKITIWGPESHVQRLANDISLLEKEAIEKAYEMYGPPVPEGKLPDGQAHKRIMVPDIAIGHVIGKERRNITKLRDDHTAALINFDGKTGVMHVWGVPTEVDEVCECVAKVTLGAKNTKKRENSRIAKLAKTPKEKTKEDFEAAKRERKMKDFEADMKTKNSSTGSDQVRKKKQKEERARRKKAKATKQEEKNKGKQQKKKAARREKLNKACY